MRSRSPPPSPPRPDAVRQRIVLLAGALMAVAMLAIAMELLRSGPGAAPVQAAAGDGAPAPPSRSGGDGVRHVERPAADLVTATPRIPAGLARAYAALGVAADGSHETVRPLDDVEAATFAARARDLLATQLPVQGAAVPTRSPTGETLRAGGVGSAEAERAAEATAPAAEGGRGADRVAPDQVANHLADAAQRPAIVGDLEKELRAADAWAAIPYQPGLVDGKPLVIRNRSGAGYAVSLQGEDFGDVRVNGGLVVPGRFYRIDREVRIQSVLPIGVEIRPLTAVPAYYPEPQPAPSANG